MAYVFPSCSRHLMENLVGIRREGRVLIDFEISYVLPMKT